MAKEIENKYLCKYRPEFTLKEDGKSIQQGYIHISPEKQVRVRLIDGEAYMCVKFMKGEFRDEFEVKMDYHEALALYKLCKYKVSKHRWNIDLGNGFHCDIDEYKDGTLITEIERPENLHLKQLPDWVGDCVDGIWEFNNYCFAGFPKSEYDATKE